ncbi:MAG: hypothetical protein H6719_05490 [Sandaracinaceae bacterium]|nr:hypothetical protein [Sandaracinaceae bacterium]
MTLPVTFPDGRGEALSFTGENLACALSRAFAPGAPLELSVALEGDEALSLRGKTIGSKRRADGRFDVRLRLLSLRREEREALRRALPG